MSGERLYLVGEKPVAPLIWHTIKSGSSAVGIGPARLRENVAQSVSAKSQYETDPTQQLQAATLRLWCAIGAHGFSLIPALEAVFRIGERGVLQPGRCMRSAAATG